MAVAYGLKETWEEEPRSISRWGELENDRIIGLEVNGMPLQERMKEELQKSPILIHDPYNGITEGQVSTSILVIIISSAR